MQRWRADRPGLMLNARRGWAGVGSHAIEEASWSRPTRIGGRASARASASHHLGEIDHVAVIFGLALGPDLLHRLDPLAHQFEAAFEHVPWSSISSWFQPPPSP